MATISSSKRVLDISSLMSPPEPPRVGSFSQESNLRPSTAHTPSDSRRAPGPIPLLSPPISPTKYNDKEMPDALSPDGSPVRDPILYPVHEATNPSHQEPLFDRDEPGDIQRTIDSHVAARSADLFTSTSPPRREHYGLALAFKVEVMKKFVEDPKGWHRRELGYLLADRQARSKRNKIKLQPLMPAKPQPIRTHAQRVAKSTTKVAKHASTPRPIRSNAPTSSNSTSTQRSPAPETTSRRGAAPNREDTDFESLPDFCPPTSTLPDKPNVLKVDWKGPPIDLSNDPHKHLVHKKEEELAAELRLKLSTYLTSKRRIFIRARECYKNGKEFRKTDAQQACNIDVNKASKLWTAFDKVGWLEKRWLRDN